MGQRAFSFRTARLARQSRVALVATVVFALAGAATVTVRVVRYAAAIAYDVGADAPSLADASRQTIELADRDGSYLLPALAAPWDAVFAEVHVDSSLLGRVLDPHVEMNSPGLTRTQYFERGARGRRYLNLSELVAAQPNGGVALRLRGVHLSVRPGPLRLLVMRSAPAPDGPLLVVAPHPDDAEIAAFGLYGKQPSWVVTVTLGETGRNLYRDFFADPREAFVEKGRMRAWDSVAIPQLGGVKPQQALNLGYFDGTLQAMQQSPDEPVLGRTTGARVIAPRNVGMLRQDISDRPATWRGLVKDLSELLTVVRPSRIATPHPLLDTHPDHQLTTIAVLEALEASGLREGRLLLYTNHPLGTELHPYGPRQGLVSLPPMPSRGAYFESIVSVPLEPAVQLRKLVALQLQQDLRPSPTSSPVSFARTVLDSTLRPWHALTEPDLSYERRAARPNEVFFTAPFSAASTIRRGYFDHPASGSGRTAADHAASR